MSYMSVTLVISQPEMSWLHDERGIVNICVMVVITLEVSQAEMPWLDDEAPRNMHAIVVTLEVSQPEMSALNDEAP